jgi:hypothetical protein
MHGTHESCSVTTEMLNFSGAASIWLQSLGNKVVFLGGMNFVAYCVLLGLVVIPRGGHKKPSTEHRTELTETETEYTETEMTENYFGA